MGQQITVTLPDIGDFKDVEIVELLVSAGDQIAAEDSVLTLETDKATMEIPSPQAGTIAKLLVQVGDTVNQGDQILVLETASSVAEAEPTPKEAVPEPEAQAPAVTESTPVATVATSTAEQPIHIPDIGDFKDVEVVEVLVSVCDTIAEEDALLTLETDKATMEIPAPCAGTIQTLEIQVGDRVNQGDLIGMVQTDAAPSAAPEPAAAAAAANVPAAKVPQASATPSAPPAASVPATPDDQAKPHAAPGVRRFARELGVALHQVTGTGRKGRILKSDVQNHVKQALADKPKTAASGAFSLPAAPEVDYSHWGEVERKPLSRIKKISGQHLHKAWLGIPHVTQFDEADITELEAFRKAQKKTAEKQDIKLTFMPFLMKALAAALVRYPQFNASLSADGGELIYKQYCHLGVAVDTPKGLMVPVIRDVDQKGVFDLARDLMTISDKARKGALAAQDMQGGCLSISSLGGIGGTQFTPIVNSPEVAILGVSRAAMQPKWDGETFVPRLMMPFSLSYDHRVIDGAEGVRFTTYLASLLSDIRQLVL
ncbi:MAG: dihydrolipoyllysine-residue acetyltransferase [Pseudomonadota bacterium]